MTAAKETREQLVEVTRLHVLLGFAALVVTCHGPMVDAAEPKTNLSISGERFLLNGKPTFLLGFSYFAALGESKEFITQDLDDFQKAGFNWLRVWATWNQHGTNIAAVDSSGGPRQPFLERLEWLIAECDKRGMAVDVTLTRGKRNPGSANSSALPDFEAHQRAVRSLIMTLKAHRNWFLDLANEHDIRDDRFVPDSELAQLRQQTRDLDPERLITASYGGHDPTDQQIRTAIETLRFDFICPHRPRGPESPGETEAKTASCSTLRVTCTGPCRCCIRNRFAVVTANGNPTLGIS